jgi:hypothetical protein
VAHGGIDIMAEINPVVLEIGKIHFEGNIIPHQWYHFIKTEKSEKTDLVAIVILAEIIYWYRPIEQVDEKTGKSLLPRQKFSGTQFQCRHRYFTEKFGLTKMQVRHALDNLVRLGLIKKTIVNRIVLKSGEILTNVMFVEPIPAEIAKITVAIAGAPSATGNTPSVTSNTPSVTSNTPSATGNTPSVTSNTPSATSGTTYTETSTNTSTKTDDRPRKNKNNTNVVSQSSVDLNIFSSLNWPKNLNKTQPVAMALAKLPDDYARQQVLDVLAQASEKGTVENSVAFLQGVVKNYLNGDFTPIEKAPAQAPVQPTTCPEVQPQNHTNDRSVSEANEKDRIDQLKQTFHENRHGQVEKLMASWDEQTQVLELAEFEKTLSRTARARYQKHGLDSSLIKSTLTDYLAKKHLPVEVSDFVTWAKTQGHDIESHGTEGGYRLNPTKHVGNILERTLSKIECAGEV